MGMFYKILIVLAAIGIVFWLYRGIKSNPAAFSKENISKSFGTVGVLGVILIAFVAFCVFLLRST